ncbi:MAG: GNAT family N-acetyltransferase [Ekhidna sp.]|uniref:GNAT family N-acetyltransferase n=1 Tax=Ekhidna sp. TaxID=2608089 RepID=UPI0032EDCC22
MSFQIHQSVADIPQGIAPTYLRKEYLHSQSYAHFVGYSNPDFFIAFDVADKVAISIPRSPFGSFFCRNDHAVALADFWAEVSNDLKSKGVEKVEIRHPSEIYRPFADLAQLQKLGFTIAFTDINQHIDLSKEWQDSIHKMQARKLQSLKEEGFEFQKMGNDQVKTAYDFLTVCRQAQGLQINIEFDHLESLIDELPEQYEIFGVFRGGKISALCIAVNVTDEIAYYYLPATSPMFRNKSPMVMLIAGMVAHCQSKRFKYLDLGVSSKEGRPQETLKLFKERMGAMETGKPLLTQLI